MRAEEYDWTIYHIITREKKCTIEDICEQSGYTLETVHESLDRLRSSLLIERRGEMLRACSIEEFMITSRMNHDPCSNIFIENGVVKVRGETMTNGKNPPGTDVGGEK